MTTSLAIRSVVTSLAIRPVESIYDWVLDHRIHHKYFGTDEDPYNYKRGIYYAHFVSKVETAHPRREEHEKEIDMSDLESDSIVMFQKRYYKHGGQLGAGFMFMDN
uniref:Uncharacterized protein n=1 Tax=Timema cristinae TaxID=61476 RepID=A0A7R9H4B1_TIMCR|nr:unnamed protein product [Timema cristinae]